MGPHYPLTNSTMAKQLTSNVRFIWQIKTPTEGWVAASSHRAAYLISQRILEAVRRDPTLRGKGFGSVREKLV